MFKKLIELFGGSSEQGFEEVQGSYLLHLLDEVQPRVREELEREPGHAPLWLVAAEIFRASGGEPLEESPYNGPVGDPQEAITEPATESAPPPPPGETPAEESDETQEFERPDDESPNDWTEAEAERSSEEQEELEEIETKEEPEATGDEEGGEEVVTEGEPADDTDEVVEVDDDETIEVDESAYEEISGPGDAEPEDPTENQGLVEESEPPPAPDAAEGVNAPPSSADRTQEGSSNERSDAAIDSPEMLRSARVFLGLLLDNARLPDALRMGVEDIQRVRTLLLGYFLGKQDVAMRANEMMGVVETKFTEGYYSQARMLLELFGVHRETRVENDRNLFFREMNLKSMGARADHQQVDVGDELPGKLRTLNKEGEGAFGAFFEWYSEQTGIDLDVCARRNADVESWRETLEPADDEEAIEECLALIPPERWAIPAQFDRSVPELIEQTLDQSHGLAVVERYLQMAYFVLRAVGDTGLEPFLESFFDWSEHVADVDAVRFLPDLHRQVAEGDRLLQDLTDEVVWEHYSEPVGELLEGAGHDAVYSALENAVEQLQDVDLNQIAPAYYDLTGFVADELFRMELPRPEFHFKLHRLT